MTFSLNSQPIFQSTNRIALVVLRVGFSRMRWSALWAQVKTECRVDSSVSLVAGQG